MIERILRALLIAAGVALAVNGLLLLLDLGTDNLLATGRWLVGGVIAHDAVLAPITIAIAAAAGWLFRGRIPGALIIGFIVLTTVTVVAIPMLGRFGERADNPTLLDRDYAAGWWIFAILTVAGAGLGWVWSALRRRAKGER